MVDRAKSPEKTSVDVGQQVNDLRHDDVGPENDASLRALFLLRAAVMALFAGAIALSPSLGEDHRAVGALVAVAVPVNLLAAWRNRRPTGMSLIHPIIDQALAAGVALTIDSLVLPALLVMVSSLALVASVHDLSRAVPVLVSAIVATAAVVVGTQDPTVSIITVVGFAGAAALAVFPASLVHAARRSLAHEHRDLVDNMDAIVWWLEEDADTYGSMSASAARILGFPDVQLQRVTFWLDHVHADDRDRVVRDRARALRTGDAVETDYRIADGAGRQRWLRDVVIPEWTMSTDGLVKVPLDRPGIGIDIDVDRIDNLTVRTSVLHS